MKENSFDRLDWASASPSQPNFDDERTVVSARRVVPLEKINSKERRRKNWILGGAFLLAMMLGAASALLDAYLKLRRAPTATSEISEVETPAAPLAVVETMANALPAELPEASPTPVTTKPAVKRRVTLRNVPDFTPQSLPRMNEEDELERIRESVLYDTWQERRARRALRRERRNRVDHHDRDLSNLDEIFEGPRRRP